MSTIIEGKRNDLSAIPKKLKEKAKEADDKKLLLICAPYVIFVYVFNKLSWLYRRESGENVFQKVLYTLSDMGKAFHNPLPSMNPKDIVVDISTSTSRLVYFLNVSHFS